MIKLENIEVFNFKGAFRGMRNPLESWHKADSTYNLDGSIDTWGESDRELAMKLTLAGNDHGKFLRQILVCMDIVAPLYWWKEFDTYKVATVANSTSTMHKLGSRELTLDDFSWDEVTDFRWNTLMYLNEEAAEWRELKNSEPLMAKPVWRRLIQDLPDSFIQRRTWTGNYANLRNMYHSRGFHKLVEWREFCKVIEKLPCSELITVKK